MFSGRAQIVQSGNSLIMVLFWDIPLRFRQLRIICRNEEVLWWRHQMETFSALLAICAGNSPVIGEFHAQRPETRSFDVFFDLRRNKRLYKQSWGWLLETLWRPLWRHCNVISFWKQQQRRKYLSVMWYILNLSCAGKFVMPTDLLRGREISTPSVALNAKTYGCFMKPFYIDKNIRQLLFTRCQKPWYVMSTNLFSKQAKSRINITSCRVIVFFEKRN